MCWTGTAAAISRRTRSSLANSSTKLLILMCQRGSSKTCSSMLNSWTPKSQRHSTNSQRIPQKKGKGERCQESCLKKWLILVASINMRTILRCTSNLRETRDKLKTNLLKMITQAKMDLVYRKRKWALISRQTPRKNCMKWLLLAWDIPPSILSERIKVNL